jgi:hypothetical protein
MSSQLFSGVQYCDCVCEFHQSTVMEAESLEAPTEGEIAENRNSGINITYK